MKILCLNGSPRSGSTSANIAAHFCATAATAGAEVETFNLDQLNYKGCRACFTCKKKLDKCGLKDDLSIILAKVMEADVLLLSSPVYFGDVTSQMKAFIDRTYSFLPPDFVDNPGSCRLPAGKQLVFIQTQGDGEEKHFADVYLRYDFFFKWFGFKDNHLIRACGTSPVDTEPAPEATLTAAGELARRITA